MRELELVILQHCSHGYVEVKALLEKYPRSSLYRTVRRLVARKLLLRSAHDYKTTPAGIRELSEHEPEDQPERPQPEQPQEEPEKTIRETIELWPSGRRIVR